MSEAVSNAEIEDVLSSIRRLVSENAGAIKRSAEDDEGPQKLVLTPAFRVDEDSVEVAEAEDGAAPEGEVVSFTTERWSPEESSETSESEEVDTQSDESDHTEERREIGAADDEVHDQNDHDEHDEHQDQHETPDHDEGSSEAGAEDDRAEDSSDVSEAEHGDERAHDEASAETHDDAPGSETLESRVAQLEAAIDRSGSEWEPDGSEEVILPDHMVFQHDTSHEHTDDAPAEIPEVEDEPAQVEADAPAPESSDEAQPEAVMAEPEPAPEPELEVTDAFAAEWEDLTLAGSAVGPNFVSFDGADEPTPDRGFAYDEPDETDVIDEAMLRDMVMRMVREELQGNIGERITHNVRRMVRREIARALALKDFE